MIDYELDGMSVIDDASALHASWNACKTWETAWGVLA